MTFQIGHSSPNLGKVTTTRPLLWDEIQKVKAVVQHNPRDRLLFAIGTNTALRSSDIVSLRWTDFEDDGVRVTALIRERKTKKLRRLRFNPELSNLVRESCLTSTSEFVISGLRGAMTTGSVGRLMKDWATKAGLDATRVAGHSLRKTFCRTMVSHYKEPLYKVMWALGHSSERITAQYVGLLQEDVAALYERVV